MAAFSRKTLSSLEPLGQKLRRMREEMEISLEDFAHEANIPLKYCKALEHGRYKDLPGSVYVRNYLRAYAQTLHVSEQNVLDLYEQEKTYVRTVGPSALPPKVKDEARSINIPGLLKRLAIAVGVVVLLVYLGVKVQSIVEPPVLAISTPAEDLITTELSVTVEGTTEPEAIVRINGQEVFTDPEGNFSELIDLQAGLNVIKISARKERSNEQVIYRQIIVEPPTSNARTTGRTVLTIDD